MAAHNFEKVLPEVYNTINKFDVICLSESYLDSCIASDKDYLNSKYYNLYRADHPNNVKRGGVCAYIRKSLPVKCLNNTHLPECIKFLLITKRVMLFHCMDPLVKLQMNINNLEKLMIDIYSRKAYFVLMICDFNAKLCNWSNNDTTAPQGAQLDSITTLYGMTLYYFRTNSHFATVFSLYRLYFH